MPGDLLCNSACFMNYNYSLLIVWHSICPPFPIKQSSRPNITALTTLVFPLRPRPTPLSASMGLRSSTLRPSLQPSSLPTPRVTRQHPTSSPLSLIEVAELQKCERTAFYLSAIG